METSWRVIAKVGAIIFFNVLKKTAFTLLTCMFASCGAFIGTIAGAMKGQTTETGLSRGAAIGAIAGAVVSMEVLESCLQGEISSKIGIFSSLLNGKVFREWVSPAILKAYQWQINGAETSYTETSDIFDISRNKGVSPEIIEKMPSFKVSCTEEIKNGETTCAVCLQDFTNGENARRMPECGHMFHVLCIHRWLLEHSSCPMCRKEINIIATQ